jgi:hypothetical protein
MNVLPIKKMESKKEIKKISKHYKLPINYCKLSILNYSNPPTPSHTNLKSPSNLHNTNSINYNSKTKNHHCQNQTHLIHSNLNHSPLLSPAKQHHLYQIILFLNLDQSTIKPLRFTHSKITKKTKKKN